MNPDAPNGLDALATESGVISPDEVPAPIGSYGRRYEGGQDRLCVLSVDGAEGDYRVGVETRIGDEEYCRGAGRARLAGDRFIVTLGNGRCTIMAHYDGDQIVMPGVVDGACSSLCSTRGSLAGVTFPRVTAEQDAAQAMNAQDGQSLCPS